MRTQHKYAALLLLVSALVVACADEPDDESTGSIEEVPAKSEPRAEQSSDTTEDVTFGGSDKALRRDFCCALKRNGGTDDCRNYSDVTALVARYRCAMAASGDFYDGHALRDGKCSKYSDCP
jgi:hypothetical protein